MIELLNDAKRAVHESTDDRYYFPPEYLPDLIQRGIQPIYLNRKSYDTYLHEFDFGGINMICSTTHRVNPDTGKPITR